MSLVIRQRDRIHAQNAIAKFGSDPDVVGMKITAVSRSVASC